MAMLGPTLLSTLSMQIKTWRMLHTFMRQTFANASGDLTESSSRLTKVVMPMQTQCSLQPPTITYRWRTWGRHDKHRLQQLQGVRVPDLQPIPQRTVPKMAGSQVLLRTRQVTAVGGPLPQALT